ncbi:major capsid protein [Spartinivicinus ruber]|uniref:major capsid protein n=1 Tax=Spartinivicinus ruber TaxID=2683272 RepID=UPI0013D09322|nr:major capsid protein [Spartinivicinus ruber]
MPTTRLTDVIIPEVYADYQAENSPEKTAFAQAGIAVSNDMLIAKANSGGKTIDIPFWRDLDAAEEPNYSNDDPKDRAEPNKIDSGEQVARVAYLNQAYSATDLAGEIAGSSPMQRIRNRFGVYWQRQWQRRLLAASQGLLASNIAQNDADMVCSIAIEDGNAATEKNKFNRSALVNAAFTLGDQFEQVKVIAVHSMIYQKMIDNDDIEFIKDSQGNLTIPTYLGRRIVVDDGMPVIAGNTSGFKYLSVLFGEGMFGYGEGKPNVPVEVERQGLQGGGGGVEYLIERKTWLIHPFGTQFSSNSVSAASATLADLRKAENWKRVVHRKNMPLAFLVTNG